MMPAGARWIALPLLAFCYAVLAHYTNTHATALAHDLGTVLALAPLSLGALMLAWGTQRRTLALLCLAAAALLLWQLWLRTSPHYSLLYWAEHAGTETLLSIGFGRTLRSTEVPMCTRFARFIDGPLSDAELVYTRQVTVVWTWFFGLLASLSTLLYFAAPLQDWSLFANFVTGPLMALLFAMEYAVRVRRFPQHRHRGLLASMKACWKAPVR